MANAELSEKDRRITRSIWRDDGFAVDWVLNPNEGVCSVALPDALLSGAVSDPATLDRLRTQWRSRQVEKLRSRYPFRLFADAKQGDARMSIKWTRRVLEEIPESSGTIERPGLLESPESQPEVRNGKRGRSVSPSTSNKTARLSILHDASQNVCSCPMRILVRM
jgi:hypothetical protein